MGDTPLPVVQDWSYWFLATLGSTFDDVMDVFADAIPIVLAVGAAYFAVRWVWRASRSLTS